MIHTVTIADPPHAVDGVFHRKLTCTCGWEGETQGYRSEAKARHHILYTHGGNGDYSFMGSVTQMRDHHP